MYIKRQNQSSENWQFSGEKQGIINRDRVYDETKINHEFNQFFRMTNMNWCTRIVKLSNAFIDR